MTRLSRRDWLAGVCAGIGAACAPRGRAGGPSRESGRIQTVTGPIAPDRLGFTLMHEHVLVDFAGAAQVSRSRYDADEVFAAVLPRLREARMLGCEALVECTPAFLGRDPLLLQRLARASGLTILTNTGYYGAANDKHLPAHAFTESAEELAARWTAEWERGIEGTGIRPAFMKIGVDGSPLSSVDATLVRAAAIAHKASGMPIASHTTSGAAAHEELDLLAAAGVPAAAFIWVHAHAERDGAHHVRAATRGAWVEFDGMSAAAATRHLDLLRRMKQEGLLARVLVSHDAGWYRVGEPGGGEFRPFDAVFRMLIPAMKEGGFSDAEVRQIFVENPRRALVRQESPLTPAVSR